MERLLSWILLLAGVPAHADFDKGANLANEARFAEALVEFDKAAKDDALGYGGG